MKTKKIYTRIKRKRIEITPEDQQLISELINKFVFWLKRKGLKDIDKTLFSFEFFEISETMKVGENNDLHFNLEYLDKCSVRYFITIVLHEAYHYFINNIPNKKDARRVKDYYPHSMMNQFDIEADLYVATFFSLFPGKVGHVARVNKRSHRCIKERAESSRRYTESEQAQQRR